MSKKTSSVIRKNAIDLKDAIENIKYTAFPGENEDGSLTPRYAGNHDW